MEISTDGVSAPVTVYEIGSQRFEVSSRGFAEAIASAHAAHLRPRCLCTPEGVEMYVARLAGPHGGYIVKRMPDTGLQHATCCPSYQAPSHQSGLGSLVGTAIIQNPATGITTLKLDFPMSKLPRRSVYPSASRISNGAVARGHRLGLRDLLYYLWDQGELTHWQSGFSGRRTWGTVRRHLLQAAENKFAHGHPLLDTLYIPEVFAVEQRDAIHSRRLRQWVYGTRRPGLPQALVLMVAEVKELAPTRHGQKIVIKHLPDQAFALGDALYRRIGRRHERELILWGVDSDLHLVIAATIQVEQACIPSILEIALMVTTAQWLPVGDVWERQLVDTMVRQGRSFVKTLRCNPQGSQARVCASLLDCGPVPYPLVIDPGQQPIFAQEEERTTPNSNHPDWRWNPFLSDVPTLPLRRVSAHASTVSLEKS